MRRAIPLIVAGLLAGCGEKPLRIDTRSIFFTFRVIGRGADAGLSPTCGENNLFKKTYKGPPRAKNAFGRASLISAAPRVPAVVGVAPAAGSRRRQLT